MTEEELMKEKARVEGQKIGLRWMKRHLADFDQSPESAKKIQDYLVEHNLDFSEESLEQAFTEQTKRGVRFTSAPVVPAPPAPLVEDPLPPVPKYMDGIRTSKDIRDIPPETFTKWRRGPDRDAFFRRLVAIKQRGL
jgi:hypothetical protein